MTCWRWPGWSARLAGDALTAALDGSATLGWPAQPANAAASAATASAVLARGAGLRSAAGGSRVLVPRLPGTSLRGCNRPVSGPVNKQSARIRLDINRDTPAPGYSRPLTAEQHAADRAPSTSATIANSDLIITKFRPS